MTDDPQKLRAEAQRLLAEAKATLDGAQRKLMLASALDLAGKAEALERRANGGATPLDSPAA